MYITYTLLEKTADETARLRRAVFQRRGCGVAVKAAHGDTKERTAGEELLVSLAEAGALKSGVLALVRHFSS